VGQRVGGSQWSLYWTARDQPVPCQLVPVLAGWADLNQREVDADIERGHPILIDPELLGYDTSGQPDLSWRGRNDGRNAAFTDLLFSSGLRL
jgi:hypothetical protein